MLLAVAIQMYAEWSWWEVVGGMKGAFGVLTVLAMVAGTTLMQMPMDAPASKLLLPWCDAILFKLTDGGDSVISTNEQQLHHRTIKHRQMSVFHDWPAPIPFPATTLYSFQSSSSSELPFSKGQDLTILDCRGNWWQARHPETGSIGFVPSNFVAVKQKATVLKAFENEEVKIEKGQTVEVMEVHEAACLVRAVDGKIGAVPIDHLQLTVN